MRLTYLVQYYMPEKSSGGVLVQDLLEGFCKHGWKVDVFTPTPTRGVSDEVRKEYCKKGKKTEIFFDGNLTIHRIPLYRERSGFIPRTLRYVIFSIQCLWKGFTQPGEIVFSGSGPPTQGVVGGLIRKFTNKKFVYNLQDIFPDSMINAGICTEKSFLVKIGRIIENFTYKNSDLIITISDDMVKNVLGKGVEPSKVFSVRNWIDIDQIVPIERNNNALFDELNLSRDNFYITYAGNLGYVQGIDYVVETAKTLVDLKEIQFVIFGNGSEEEKIKQMISEYQLDNVHLFSLQPAERMSEVYSFGDVSLVSCRSGVGSAGMPSKTWIIMASGTAVLGFFDLDSEFTKTIDEAKCGICVQAGNVEALKEQILYLKNHSDICTRYGINARTFSVDYVSKERAVQNYIDIIESIR